MILGDGLDLCLLWYQFYLFSALGMDVLYFTWSCNDSDYTYDACRFICIAHTQERGG